MDTSRLKKFAQYARRSLLEQVESKLNLVSADESEARRESPRAIAQLERKLEELGREQLIEQVAYTWFNRFCALRFMDANQYNRIRVISPLSGQFQPEILAEAKAGHIDEGIVNASTREKVFALLGGSLASRDGQSEAFRLLIVAVCNDLNTVMPYLFERIEDYTELLMPEDLLSGNSILAYTREAMTPEACESVETIGWLYQFYISEKKDQVFAGLKKNQKITAENIPAATQLFTPHWIVRYLVENSLGRLWLLNRPQSRLAERMDYYIAPEEPETDFLRITRPEDIRICDPAAGSGHMLTYAFDLLYAIYEEEGYDPSEIPALILTHNLTGVEIDDRAGALAAFALAMKAAAKLGRRRFLRMEVKPDICVLQNVSFTEVEMQDVAAVVGKDLFTDELRETLGQFEQAKNFGSLIVPKLRDPAETLRVVEAKDFSGELWLKEVQARVVAVLRMAEALSPKYHVVVANPPYMGGKGMNGSLGDFAKARYPDSKSDLFAMFMERAMRMALTNGMMAMINMQSWMFLSSYEKLRNKLFSNSTLVCMAHLGERAFDTIGGAVVSTTAFVFKNTSMPAYLGSFVDLKRGKSEFEKKKLLEAVHNGQQPEILHHASSNQILSIPGSPVAYSASMSVKQAFANFPPLSDISEKRLGLCTGNNDEFILGWWEASFSRIGFGNSSVDDFLSSKKRYAPHNKGGIFRRWTGNQELVIKFDQQAFDRLVVSCNRLASRSRYFRPCITWSEIGSTFAVRKLPQGFVFNIKGPSIFSENVSLDLLTAYLNSKVFDKLLGMISATISFNGGEVEKIPTYISGDYIFPTIQNANRAFEVSLQDYTGAEEVWDFTTLPLLQPDHRAETLEVTYTTLRTHWQGMTDEMITLEEENNRIFIDAYRLQDELTPEVPLNEITLTCNPAYRYGIKNDAAANEARLRADTMAEFLSYAVGCMFGRYSLDAPGLMLANQGETLADYLARVPDPSFLPDKDNVVPLIDFEGDWFEDDMSERFKQFLKVTFGEELFTENLAFIESALGKDLKKYFIKDFYADHVKRYKKRPIYWLFSSPKGSFNALIYLHRYGSDTVSVVLNDYLREFCSKLEARKESYAQVEISVSASAKEKTQAIKAIQKIDKAIAEVNDYEHEVLYPLAGEKIEIDLDDGVKHNYPLFGKALKKIPGLS